MDPQIGQLLADSRTNERAGNIAAALELAQRALEMARADGDPKAICSGFVHIATVHYRLGHYEQATQLAMEALTYADDVPDSANALLLIGLAAAESGDLSRAEEFFHRAADLSRQIGYVAGRSWSLHNLAALVYTIRGQFGLALATIEEAYRLNQESNEPNWGYPLLKAWIYLTTGDRQQVRQALEEVARIALPGSLI
ncbi:MAG: tetratricopeptide repeat protein, partial [Ardenticatenaceae bacterium]